MKRYINLMIFLSLFIYTFGQNRETEILYHQKIPVRDGINLSATIVKPKEMTEPLPVLLVLTPYIADRNIPSALYFAKHDYIVVTTDTRGRGNSEGLCTPFDTIDGKDGYDICKWITEQPWCIGKIGMYGGSYLGMTQWQTLKENPPGLTTIVPTASVCPGIDFPKRNNVFYTYLGPYFVFISGKTANTNSFTNTEYWSSVYKRFFNGDISFSHLIDQSGISGTPFNTWLNHPYYDDYWKKTIPEPQHYKSFKIPILTITGYYDDDQHGAMHYYRNHLKYSDEAVKNQHYLIIGPWDHGGTRNPKKEIGDLSFSEESLINLNEIHLNWFNHTLKGQAKPSFLEKNITYYIMGKERWCYSDHIDLSQGKNVTYYLAPKGDGKNLFSSGLLTEKSVNNPQPSVFHYDPLNTIWSDFDLEEGHLVNYSLYRNREVFKGEGLTFCSEPLTQNITIAGQVELSVFLSMDVRDADFEFLLYEIQKDGKLIFLTTDFLRARFKDGLEKEIPIPVNTINEYRFKTPYFIIREIQEGSRIVLIFRNLNSPHYQKNFQSGKNVSHEKKEDACKGTFKVYHNAKCPSSLILPISQ